MKNSEIVNDAHRGFLLEPWEGARKVQAGSRRPWAGSLDPEHAPQPGCKAGTLLHARTRWSHHGTSARSRISQSQTSTATASAKAKKQDTLDTASLTLTTSTHFNRS